ncbi:MAG: hypothetical protein HOV79_34810 [Hamadaea sp.]|nr:hypothetical protein [Hamadaea sp.]
MKTADGLTVLRDGEPTRTPAGVVSMLGSTVCLTEAQSGRTSVDFLAAHSGARTGAYSVAGTWTPRVTNATGDLVALAAPSADPARPEARKQTTIVVAGSAKEVARVTLPGVIEPDAFSADGTSLFVLEWLPASAPDHYRVRRLELSTETLFPLLTRTKIPVPPGKEEEMRGEGRLAVPSPTGSVLYTLYTHQPGHQHTRNLVSGRPGNVHAFVHTLQTAEGWAFCVDLPAPFGESVGSAHAIALNSNGGRLFVADVAKGNLARIDTEGLAVENVVKIAQAGEGPAYAVSASGKLFLGAGKLVQILGEDGAKLGEWKLPESLRGLALSGDRTRLYVASKKGVAWRDVATGEQLGEVAVAGLTALVRAA